VVENIIGVEIGNMFIGLGIGGYFQIDIEAEYLPDRHFHVGRPAICWFAAVIASPWPRNDRRRDSSEGG
jgi:hypothetical protein